MKNRSWIVMGVALALAARAVEAQEQPQPTPASPPAPALEAPPATLDTPAEEPSPLLIPDTPAPPVAAPPPTTNAASRTPATSPKPVKPVPEEERSAAAAGPKMTSKPLSGTAVIKEDRVNVRSRPVHTSEVIAQLNSGDPVEVLEQITIESAKPGEPATWTKIKLPSTNYVWISSKFIDPSTKAVTASRLNVRAGPGENHGVLGRIDKGTTVHEVEAQGEWLKIPAPPDAYAFVASFLIEQPGQPELATTPTATAPSTTPTQTTAAPVTAQAEETPAAGASTTAAEPAGPEPGELQPAVAEAEVQPELAAPEPPAQPVLVKRIVSREGIVRRSVSIQAPTEFVLESPETHKTINYLYESPRTEIVLRNYEGQRILVTGEELLDERWPKTPVMNIEKLRARP